MRKLLLIVMVLTMVGCAENFTERNYVVEYQESTEIDEIITEGNMFIRHMDNYVLIYTDTEEYVTITVTDTVDYSTVLERNELKNEFLVMDMDISNGNLYYLGLNVVDEVNQLKSYNISTKEETIVDISNFNIESIYPDSLIVDERVILVSTSTRVGSVINYLIDIESELVQQIQSYNNNDSIYGITLEQYYGSRDYIANGNIILSSKGFTDTYNYIGVYDFKNGNEVNRISVYDNDVMCSIYSTRYINDYLFIKAECSSMDYFVVYNIDTMIEEYRFEYPFDYVSNESKIKGINDDYVLITDGNYNYVDGKIVIYDLNNEEFIEVPNSIKAEWFGSNIYLYEESVIIVVNGDGIYEYNITEKAMTKHLSFDYIDKVHGVFYGNIVYSTTKRKVNYVIDEYDIVAYNFLNETETILSTQENEISDMIFDVENIYAYYYSYGNLTVDIYKLIVEEWYYRISKSPIF